MGPSIYGVSTALGKITPKTVEDSIFLYRMTVILMVNLARNIHVQVPQASIFSSYMQFLHDTLQFLQTPIGEVSKQSPILHRR